MKAPQVHYFDTSEDQAHYHAETALDEVLGWFLEHGYDFQRLGELASEHVERVTDNE